MPLVSLLVLNYNGADRIEKCLSSLLSQDYQKYEIIVVDNASSDGSAELVAKFGQVRLLRNLSNLGVPAGLNAGIRIAKGKLIAILNNDVVIDSGWLRAIVSAMAQFPRIGVAGGPTFYYSAPSRLWALGASFDCLTGSTYSPHRHESWDTVESLFAAGDVLYVDYVPSCAVVLTRDLIEKLGSLDEHYFLYGDELDYCTNARRMGYLCAVVKHARSWHMVSESARKRTATDTIRDYYGARGMIHFYLKNLPLPVVVCNLAFQLLILTMVQILLFHSESSLFGLKIQALVWNLRLGRQIIRERDLARSWGEVRLRFSPREALAAAQQRAWHLRYLR